MAINESVTGDNSIAITGTSTGAKSTGVKGIGNGDAVGVKGEGDSTGVWGHGKTWMGVFGFSQSSTGGAGVMGEGDPGPGVIGKSAKWIGVYGETNGSENGPAGVWGDGKANGDGVKGHASGQGKAGVAGFHLTNKGPGIYGKGSPAGFFEGNVDITGNLTIQGVSIQSWLQRIVQLEQQSSNGAQLAQRIGALEQRVANLQSQVNTAVSNLTGRVSLTEVAISDLKAKVINHSDRLNALET